MKNQDDIAGLLLLGDDYLLGSIDNEVAALVVHALFIADYLLVIAVIQVALR